MERTTEESIDFKLRSYLVDGIVMVEMRWVNCDFVDSAEVSLLSAGQRQSSGEREYGCSWEGTWHKVATPEEVVRNELPLVLEEATRLHWIPR